MLAFICANTSFSDFYFRFIQINIGLPLTAGVPLAAAVNNGLMLIFFFLVGLELKREFLIGYLSTTKKALFPIIAAFGGALLPAVIYHFFNSANSPAENGWGIPMATDIAFAVGVLSLFGSRIPASLKIFLLTLAIVDDLIAILVIALFYAPGFSVHQLTLVAVILAFFIPLKKIDRMIVQLHPWVNFFILPLFAFFNAGVDIRGIDFSQIFSQTVFSGIFLGFLIGKPIGILLITRITTALGVTHLPAGVTWKQIAGVGILASIGFTMALFIQDLALHDAQLRIFARFAILITSVMASILGWLWFRFLLNRLHS